MSKDNLWASPGLITSEDNLQVFSHLSNLRASPGFYANTTYLTNYARSPSFERSQSGSQTRASLLLSKSYQKCKSDQSNQIVVFQKKHTTSQITSGNIFCPGCTQHHAWILHAIPRYHTWSHTKATHRNALPINGNVFPIQIYITLQVNFLIHFILDPLVNCTL